MSEAKGVLYIVATPIGNLDDMTPRAVAILKSVDLIAAEDTRHSGKLLSHFGVDAPMTSLHQFNEESKTERLLSELAVGKSIALISDAGTPLISDPGFPLVRATREAGFVVTPVPGACALVAALSASGMPSERFVFEGFLPAKGSGRRGRLQELTEEPRTMVFYESPHRILAMMEDLEAVMGPAREVVIARELTKTFETIKAGCVQEVKAWMLADGNQQRGEFVVLVKGERKEQGDSVEIKVSQLLQALLKELPVKKAAALASSLTGVGKNELYQQALALKGE
ncbi:16S rRNA (cytidine(1402)-2'-O)-methyltransferase [Hahella sp. KA22]|uniref:16S rRNA (cytidine(1402)-2'-O)-methyltransferase n=1 Tax=Hahella sp. KA22 TaxID=1628392 RepID=UPI000FDF3087|nr:16S rRNA (cytidine(1402)-2'-O)-methyltransferase [Hahella sp. KA22]AZZ90486.1 16S rRNA (cytidine(1402)-2'-O)-methyltransferase [Hahella sp. KA22]QAY53856.1 16S rRNA (cytidine(1402)-2'-O)-methyltransferase [Hahella sp. KA22]